MIVMINKAKEFMNMTFYSYLKNARERCRITQSDLAEKIDVSLTTIQNWEKDTLPDKSYWKVIIKQLKLNKEEFVRHYTDAVLPCENQTETQPFPDFLFPDNMLNTIKKIRLTADEQELLGLEAIYSVTRDMDGSYHYKITESRNLPILPYEYVRRVGAFQIMNLNDSLSDKFGRFRTYVISQIKKHPEETFDILKCSPAQLLNLCDYIEIKPKNYYYDAITLGKQIRTIINLLKEIENAGDSLVIAETNNDRHSYSKWKSLDDYSSFIDRDGDLRYEQFTKLVEKESQDIKYIEAKEKYEKDKLFYEEHSSMMDYCPEAPKYRGTQNIEMSEQGRQLLTWYENNF